MKRDVKGVVMRDDVVEVSAQAMEPVLRALILYESNGSLDVAEPQALIDEIRRDSPVVRWELGVGFFTMADVVAAGRNPDLVSTNPITGVPYGMGSEDPLIPLHLDGERHRHYRRLLDPLFTPKKMAALEPGIRKLADELIDGFIGDGSTDLHETFCVPLPSTVFLQLFGMPLQDMEVLIEFKDRILKNEGTSMEEKEVLGIQAGKEMRGHLRMRLEERKASGSRFDDLLDSFMHFEVDGHRLSDADVVNIMHMFTIAGLDTVTSSLSCLLAWFATHDRQRREVVADPALLAPAIEELMRFESPVPSSGTRWAAVDTEVNGVPIKQGEMVYLCWASANVDPDGFDRPLDVDLRRESNRHIAFAAGVHRCLGSHLARSELRIALDQFHRRIPDYWPSAGQQIEFQLAGVRQARRLPVTFNTRVTI
jgi:cytochrome P450